MKTHVVIEFGAKVQLVLNAQEWRTVCRGIFSIIDRDNYHCLSDVLDENSNRTVISNRPYLRESLSLLNGIMYNLSYNSSADYEYRILMLKVLLLVFHCLNSGANLALNFVERENEMYVFPRGGYVVGCMKAIFLGAYAAADIPETLGVFDFQDEKIAQFNTGSVVAVDSNTNQYQLWNQFVCIVPMYMIPPDELHRIMRGNANYAKYVFSKEPFRASCQRDIFNIDASTIYLGPVQFEGIEYGIN